jgi:hypothetical protein
MGGIDRTRGRHHHGAAGQSHPAEIARKQTGLALDGRKHPSLIRHTSPATAADCEPAGIAELPPETVAVVETLAGATDLGDFDLYILEVMRVVVFEWK